MGGWGTEELLKFPPAIWSLINLFSVQKGTRSHGGDTFPPEIPEKAGSVEMIQQGDFSCARMGGFGSIEPFLLGRRNGFGGVCQCVLHLSQVEALWK